MSKRIIVPAVAALIALTSAAAPLSPQQALERAKAQTGMRKAVASKYSAEPVMVGRSVDGQPALYVFNNQSEGFIIVSGDDNAYPVLGYSDSGKFDESAMPDGLKYWLDEYAAQIAAARKKGQAGSVLYAPEDRTVITPLLKTNWDQGEPYNNMCPVFQGKYTYTGCVATSMAQLMNYFKYPEVGHGTVSYTAAKINQNLKLDLGARKFDWSNMLNYYTPGSYTKEQEDAVAYLMKACGYSINMNYGIEASGASGQMVGTALRNYFDYDANTHSEYRMRFNSTDWSNMVYANLKNVGPVIINGQAPNSGGHSFVCDGYDGNGYFHINWGWGGMSNGYFALEALNPGAQGIGGFSDGYNFFQDALFGARPNTGNPATYERNYIIMFGAAQAVVSGEDININPVGYNPCGIGCADDEPVTVNLGVIMEPIDGTPGKAEGRIGRYGNGTKLTLSPNSYYNGGITLSVSTKNLEDGRYKAIVACRDRSSGTGEWIPVWSPYGYANYFYVNVKDGEVTVENVPVDKFIIESVKCESVLYYNKNVKMLIKLVNDTDLELTQGVCPQLLKNGKVVMTGESVLMTVPPKTTIEKEWITRFQIVQGASKPTSETEYELIFENPSSQAGYGSFGTIAMKPAPRVTNVILDELSIKDTPTKDITYGDSQLNNVYLVNSDCKFTVEMEYSCTMGYMDGKLVASIRKSLPSAPNRFEPVVDEVFSVTPFLMSGESRTATFDVDFPEAESDTLYGLFVYYISEGNEVQKGSVMFMTPIGDGVEGVIADGDEDAVYFNLQGVRVENPEPGNILIKVAKGKAQKVIVRN